MIKLTTVLFFISNFVVADEFISMSALNKEYGEGFTSISEVYSNDIIFSLVNNKVFLSRVEKSRIPGVFDIEEAYGPYSFVGKKVEPNRTIFSKFLSEHEIGAQAFNGASWNAVLEIQVENERVLYVWLGIPELSQKKGRIVSSWTMSVSLTNQLREVLLVSVK